MAVKASANITLFHVIDIDSTTIYYLLQSSTANPPSKPTTDNPGGNWSTTEPTYTEGSTNTLYTVTKTKYSDGTFEYTPVSKSTSYEAAKIAYNKAYNVENTISDYILSKEIIIGTQTAKTNAWTGVANFGTLSDGQEIIYWLPYDGNGSNVTLNLTLSGGGTTGAKNVYYSGSSRCTTHYKAGNVVRMVYRVNASVAGTNYTGWWCDANYTDGNNTDRLRFQNNIKTGKQYVWSSRVLVSDSDGYFPLHGEVSFDRDKALLMAGSNIGPYSTGTNNFIAYPGWDLRYNAYQFYSNSTWNNGTLYNRLPIEIPSGNKIYSGTTITGTSTTATIFSGSEISNANVNDRYINTSNGNYYKCTTAGAASVAKWVYEGNSVIPAGKRLYWGTHLTHTDGTSKNTATGIASAGVGDVYINHSTGRLYQCDTAGASGTAKWKDYGVRMQTNKTVYLVGVLTGNTILVDSWPFTTELPTEDDGKIYIAIGMAYQVYACGLFPEHPMFMYKDGMFKSMEQITYDSLVVAKEAASAAESAKTKIQNFLEGDAGTEGSFEAYKREVNQTINTSTGEIVDHFSTYMRNSEFGQTLLNSSELLEKIDSYIKMKTNSQGQPYLELGVQPTQSIPNTYRLRLENDEIYMVYGSGDTESLTHLTSWSTKDGKSKFEVNTLVTQEEMAIEPFRFIKNDDGSLSFRKVE